MVERTNIFALLVYLKCKHLSPGIVGRSFRTLTRLFPAFVTNATVYMYAVESVNVCVRGSVMFVCHCSTMARNVTQTLFLLLCFVPIHHCCTVFCHIKFTTELLFGGMFFILWKVAQKKSYSSLTFHPECYLLFTRARPRETWWLAQSLSRGALVFHSLWAPKDKAV